MPKDLQKKHLASPDNTRSFGGMGFASSDAFGRVDEGGLS